MAENSHHLTILAYFWQFFAIGTTFMCHLNSKCTSSFLIHMARWLEAIESSPGAIFKSGGGQKKPFLWSKWTIMVGCHTRPMR